MSGGRREEPSKKGSSGHGLSREGPPREEPSQEEGPQEDLLQALDDYRAGLKDLKEAAAEAGVTSWDLLEAVQATPDPMVAGLDEPSGLQPFVRRRDD